MGAPRFIDNKPSCDEGTAMGMLGCQAKQQVERTDELDGEALAQLILALLQMLYYYRELDDAIDKRDWEIDKQLDFIQELEDYKDNQDFPMLDAKKSVLGIPLPDADVCVESGRYLDEAMNDGRAVQSTAKSLSDHTCGRIPVGWGLHDGELMGALAGPYASNILAGNAKRRQERFRMHKTDLVKSGQVGMKASYNANDILAQYSQATAIYAGLADIFIQGFNSAGAALGVALGRLSSNTATTNPALSTNVRFSDSYNLRRK